MSTLQKSLKKLPLPVLTISGIITLIPPFVFLHVTLTFLPTTQTYTDSHRSRQTHQPVSKVTEHNSPMKVSLFFSPHKVIGPSPPSACQRGQSGALRRISISLSHSYTASWLLAVWEAHRTLPWAASSQICHPN